MTNFLPFLDEVRKHLQGRVTHFTGKEQTYPALQHAAVTGKQLHSCIQTHALVSQHGYAKMQSEVQYTQVTEITCKLTLS